MINKPKSYVKKRIQKLFNVDKYRRYRLLEVVQYTILYVLITMFLAPRIDTLFPEYNEQKNYNKILFEAVLQLIVVSISIFYIRKIVKIIPPIGLFLDKSFHIGTTPDFNGGIVMGLIFVHCQKHLQYKLSYLVHNLDNYLSSWMYYPNIPRFNELI